MAFLGAAALGEALGVADIIAEIGTFLEPGIEALEISAEDDAFFGADYVTPQNPAARNYGREAAGFFGVGEGIALPGEINHFKHEDGVSSQHFGTRTSNGNKGSVYTGSFPDMPGYKRKTNRKPYSGRRKGNYVAKRNKRRRISTGAAVGVASSRIASASRHNGKRIVVLKKLAQGPTPTTREGGSSMSNEIRNYGSKTTPDGEQSFGYSFSLSQFPSYSNFTGIYQWYKILWVKLHFYPLQTTWPALSASTATNPIIGREFDDTAGLACCVAPTICVAPDHQSDALFSSLNNAMEHDGAKLHVFNDTNEFSVFLSPKPTGLVGSAGSEVVYLTPENKWITTSSATVPHYGLRCYVKMQDAVSVQVYMEMKVAFRGNKDA